MPGSSTSAAMRCVKPTRSGWRDKLDTFTDQHRATQTRVRGLIWDFYADLKADQLLETRQTPGVSVARNASTASSFAALASPRWIACWRGLHRQQGQELLMVLDRSEIPLHTNGSENDIAAAQVTRRKISAGTRSDIGRDCRDAFLKSHQDLRQALASRSGITWAAGST